MKTLVRRLRGLGVATLLGAATWGAAATGATAWLVFTTPVVALGCAALGGIASVGALALARRPAADASDPGELPPAA